MESVEDGMHRHRAMKMLETLQSLIETETINQRNLEDEEILSTVRDSENKEKKLASLVVKGLLYCQDQASQDMQVLIGDSQFPAAEVVKKDLILDVAIQVEITRALEMRSVVSRQLLDPDIVDLNWLAEVAKITLGDSTTIDDKQRILQRLQTASAITLSNALEWLADVIRYKAQYQLKSDASEHELYVLLPPFNAKNKKRPTSLYY
ncbi:hypothetical protein C8R41DRAFT_869349 [Lentinula lateritia]|uniref:Uncharacterized protein n=1 Tax=Lentinula lateritia TaxID=40482 RepID=A0ABQ8VAS5_9AGAR|nr:hypothetical protein C8R41DRAFT_869349 [Lentinula lateritia]